MPIGSARRRFLRQAVGVAAAPFLAHCSNVLEAFKPGGNARLTARPAPPTATLQPGRHSLGLGDDRDGTVMIPTSYRPDVPVPLVLALHGAGQRASEQTRLLTAWYNTAGFAVLAVDSRGPTWDGISYRFGTDVAFIDAALRFVFDRVAVDPARIVVEGFSDGASYSLALALANGDLFRRAVAFSPGFIPEPDSAPVGAPSFFVAHGRDDGVIPVGASRDGIVPDLRKKRYPVEYLEFDGGHEVPPPVLRSAVEWFVA